MNRLPLLRRLVAVTLIVGLSVTGLSNLPDLTDTSPAKADEVRRFVISAHDGYDLDDCMASSNSCAQLVANAWCDAKGYRHAIGLEPVQEGDITASLATRAPGASSRNAVLITCSK